MLLWPLTPRLIAFITVTLIAGAARADEPVDICYETWEPYSYTGADGAVSGVQIDITRAAFERIGRTVTFTELPYQRCVVEVTTGLRDAMLLTDSEPSMTHGENYTAVWLTGFYVRADLPLERYEALDDFDGLVLGVVDGYAYPAGIESFAGWARKESSADAAQLLQLMDGNVVDAILDDVLWVASQVKRNGYAIKPVAPIYSAVPQYTHFNANRRDLMVAHDDALGRLLADGTVDQLYEAAIGETFSDLKARGDAAFIAE